MARSEQVTRTIQRAGPGRQAGGAVALIRGAGPSPLKVLMRTVAQGDPSGTVRSQHAAGVCYGSAVAADCQLGEPAWVTV